MSTRPVLHAPSSITHKKLTDQRTGPTFQDARDSARHCPYKIVVSCFLGVGCVSKEDVYLFAPFPHHASGGSSAMRRRLRPHSLSVLQQNVVGSVGWASPMGSPRLDAQEPGSCVYQNAAMLPTSSASGMSEQAVPWEPTRRPVLRVVHSVSW